MLHICTYTYICIYIYIHTQTHIYTYTYTHEYIHLRKNTYANVYTYLKFCWNMFSSNGANILITYRQCLSIQVMRYFFFGIWQIVRFDDSACMDVHLQTVFQEHIHSVNKNCFLFLTTKIAFCYSVSSSVCPHSSNRIY